MHNAVFSILFALATTVFAALASAEVPTKADDEAQDVVLSVDRDADGEDVATVDAPSAPTHDEAPVVRG